MCHETIIDNAKVRISENNTKQNSNFLFLLSSKSAYKGTKELLLSVPSSAIRVRYN